MQRHDKRNIYFLADENRYYIDDRLRGSNKGLTFEELVESLPPEVVGRPFFKFGRMFEHDAAPEVDDTQVVKREVEKLKELGKALNKPPLKPTVIKGVAEDDSVIPSGYTYLGQFITHEISFDGIPYVLQTITSIDRVPQKRSPSIDCDSLYGAGPKEAQELYEAEAGGTHPVRLRIGSTVESPKFGLTPPRDLPRCNRQAIIGDPRNDENMALAQTHVAFILFHNEIVKQLSQRYSGKTLFDKAREQVIRHFQWIILEDYLPRVINKEILKEVIDYARENNFKLKYFKIDPAKGVYMPVEFSVAAYRLGHSMVRASYEWNLFHNSQEDEDKATLDDFFRLTGFSGALDGKPNLKSEWIVDWRHFYDFTEVSFEPLPAGYNLAPHPLGHNRAKMIDTRFDFHLNEVIGYPHHENDPDLRSITVRNLLRGFALRLPTGQAIARRIGLRADEILTPEMLAESWDAEISDAVQKYEFDKNTPLWYYILKEAEKLGEGNLLGPLGSRIVAETFVGIILHSEYSIIKDNWSPDLGVITNKRTFRMVDMLTYTRNFYPKDKKGSA